MLGVWVDCVVRGMVSRKRKLNTRFIVAAIDPALVSDPLIVVPSKLNQFRGNVVSLANALEDDEYWR